MKFKDLSKLDEKEKKDKLKDLELELVKGQVDASRGGKVKIKEIKKTIARLKLMLKK